VGKGKISFPDFELIIQVKFFPFYDSLPILDQCVKISYLFGQDTVNFLS